MNEEHEHFAIGLVVEVREGALPAGLEDVEPSEYAPDGWREVTGVGDDGQTFEVAGWWWNPTDLIVRGHR